MSDDKKAEFVKTATICTIVILSILLAAATSVLARPTTPQTPTRVYTKCFAVTGHELCIRIDPQTPSPYIQPGVGPSPADNLGPGPAY